MEIIGFCFTFLTFGIAIDRWYEYKIQKRNDEFEGRLEKLRKEFLEGR